MESKELPIWEKVLNDVCFKECGHIYDAAIFLGAITQNKAKEINKKASHEYAVLFAKHHRKEMIEAVKENIKEVSYSLNVHPVNFNKYIENAYKESEIK